LRPPGGGLGPLAGVTPAGLTLANIDGPALIVAQNTFARNRVLDRSGRWEVKDQYNTGRGNAQVVGAAKLVVQNGLGYDTYMNRIEDAAPDPSRKVIDVQYLLGLPDSTANPHLWYQPRTMPAVARALVADLSSLQPAHAAYFAASSASRSTWPL